MSESTPQAPWFKRRRYGYGWTPVTWQGWIITGAFLIVCVGGITVISQLGVSFLLKVISAAIVLMALYIFIRIVVRRGPPPKWHWGDDDNKKSK